jgi:hypothetical protein
LKLEQLEYPSLVCIDGATYPAYFSKKKEENEHPEGPLHDDSQDFEGDGIVSRRKLSY